MIETKTGTNRSAGVAYQTLLDQDSRPVPEILREQSPLAPGPTRVPAERYYSRAFHDLEVEKVWKRVWQMACHEDHVPNVGDHVVYDIAHLSFLVVRTGTDEFRAFHNACLHRGRQLKTQSGCGAREIRCPFHGWCWNLDGSLKEVPCHWDFPSVTPSEYRLPEVKVGRWGGFLFINPDPDAEPLEDFLGNLSAQFPSLPYERRYLSAHVSKILRCNWKVAQEAFSEAYHVVATHPTILDSTGDANSQYDVFGNYSRAITPNFTPSPHLSGVEIEPLEGARMYTRLRHPYSGYVYARAGDNLVHVIEADGTTSRFRADGTWIDGPLTHADPHMLDWIGGRQLPKADGIPLPAPPAVPAGKTLRELAAVPMRESLRAVLGDLVDRVCDAELLDSIYYTVFPNFHPWGSFNRIVYRFRPHGDNPEECIMECMYMSPVEPGAPRPRPAAVHHLGADDDWVDAPELGLLAKVFNQDVVNMPRVQKGLKSLKRPEIIFANYGETKPRHFHALLEAWLAKP